MEGRETELLGSDGIGEEVQEERILDETIGSPTYGQMIPNPNYSGA